MAATPEPGTLDPEDRDRSGSRSRNDPNVQEDTAVLPDPLHPAVVHLPIAMTVLLPVVAVGALWALRRGAPRLLAWGVVVGFAAALAASSWLALETGERDEERVEEVVPERAVHEHEEAGERFMAFVVAVLVVTALGLVPGRVGSAGRVLGLLAALALVVSAWRVGHSGGELVYRHGAAAAYVTGTPGGGETSANRADTGEARERERDDD